MPIPKKVIITDTSVRSSIFGEQKEFAFSDIQSVRAGRQRNPISTGIGIVALAMCFFALAEQQFDFARLSNLMAQEEYGIWGFLFFLGMGVLLVVSTEHTVELQTKVGEDTLFRTVNKQDAVDTALAIEKRLSSSQVEKQ